jgi:DNA-binding SARP family transcriptional activator
VTFGVLGPLSVRQDGQLLAIGGQKQRLVLAMLILNAGRPVSVDRLIDGVWEDDPPTGATNTVQVYVSQLRRALAHGDAAIITQPPGYLIRAPRETIDLLVFEDLISQAQDDIRATRPVAAVDALGEALSLWRGVPLEDLGSNGFVESGRTFLEERRLGVVDDRLELLLELGRDREVAETSREVLAESPLRESIWEKLIVSLYRTGRQAEALAAYRSCRDTLLDELGVEPTPKLKELEGQILNHDARLQPRRGSTDALVVPQAAPTGRSGSATVLRPRRLNAELVLGDGTVVPLSDRVILGRHVDCDVVLDDSAVSRRHAEIRLASGRHVLLDLSSSNGTWMNGEPILQHLLVHEDTFQIGDHTLQYRTG